MSRYRKRPVIVDAFQMTADRINNPSIWPSWLAKGPWYRDADRLMVLTLEGEHVVSPGDWIIRGVQGEIYPCKPDVFAETYEAVV